MFGVARQPHTSSVFFVAIAVVVVWFIGSNMAAKEKPDLVHLNQIHAETVRKEQRHQILHTEFSINPHRKLCVLPDKPMSQTPTEGIVANSDFIEAFHKARQVPTKKYPRPQTESQEIGWISTPLIQSNRGDRRLNFQRSSTDVTIHEELSLRASRSKNV